MSTVNVSGLARLSCDTRWQPANEPADPRYVGKATGHLDAAFGLSAQEDEATATLEAKRQKQGEGKAAAGAAATTAKVRSGIWGRLRIIDACAV